MFELELRLPSVEQYRELRRAVGWSVPNVITTERALAKSIVGSTVRDEGQVVGMGRVIGDAALYWFVVDVVVIPSHQRRGIGRMIVESLDRVLTASGETEVRLVADPTITAMCTDLGFEETSGHVLAKASSPA